MISAGVFLKWGITGSLVYHVLVNFAWSLQERGQKMTGQYIKGSNLKEQVEYIGTSDETNYHHVFYFPL